MRTTSLLLLALPLGLLAAARPADDPDTLFRHGDAAYRAGEAGRAAAYYDQAGLRTPHPSRSAFNVATARYRQVREGQLAHLGEAEVHYRACLQPGDEFRARALFGLGNCLMIRATADPTLDRAALKSAIDCYSQCLDDPLCDASLADDARHNRTRARLLLLQAPPPASGAQDDPPPGDEPKDDDEPETQTRPKDGKQGANGEPDSEQQPGNGKDTPSQSTEKKDGKQGGGRSTALPPPSDSSTPLPLARDDAIRHLEAAARRIAEESAQYRRGKIRPARSGVKDW